MRSRDDSSQSERLNFAEYLHLVFWRRGGKDLFYLGYWLKTYFWGRLHWKNIFLIYKGKQITLLSSVSFLTNQDVNSCQFLITMPPKYIWVKSTLALSGRQAAAEAPRLNKNRNASFNVVFQYFQMDRWIMLGWNLFLSVQLTCPASMWGCRL